VETIQTEWNAVLRQAVIRVKPDYFALSNAEREHYRLRLNRKDEFRIRQTVIKELFGIAVSMTEELDAILETFDDSQYLSLNSTLLPLQGTYMRGRYEALLDRFNTSPTTCVYMRNRNRDNEPHMNFVFSDATAMDAVRFRHFVRDCRCIAGDPAEVDNLIEQEKHLALDFLANTCKDIMDNFDPTVVMLRRKRKIILANKKLKDLL
jgi:hypothetical protein